MIKNFLQLYKQQPEAIKLWQHIVLAMAVALLTIIFQISRENILFPSADALLYLSIAVDLVKTGIFTDGYFQKIAEYIGPQGQGMFFPPLYPFFLSTVMHFDPGFYQMAQCLVIEENRLNNICELSMKGLIISQAIIASCSLFMIWLSAYIITKNKRTSWCAMFLAALAQAYAYYATQALNENLVFPLFSAFCLFLVLGIQTKNWKYFLVSGVTIGILSLTRPSYLYIAYMGLFCAALFFLWGLIRNNKGCYQTTRLLLVLFIGFAATLAPWSMRNASLFNQYTISSGYAPFILVQRVAYNQMTPKEWLVSFVYGLPDFGDNLAEKYFNETDYKRFRYDEPTGFYYQGNGPLKEQLTEDAGGRKNLLSHLLKNYVLGDLLKHVMVTFSLVWSGMWVSKYWGLIAIPIFLAVTGKCLAVQKYDLILYSIPAWFMLGLNAFTSVNVVRYNLVMIPCLAIAVAILISFLLSTFKKPSNFSQRIEAC